MDLLMLQVNPFIVAKCQNAYITLGGLYWKPDSILRFWHK